MILLDGRRRIFAIALSALAGYVDAVGFVATGGYFLSFMSGNSTRMAVGLESDALLVLMPLGLIFCFLLGVMAGCAIGEAARERRPHILLWSIGAALSAAVLLHHGGVFFLPYGLAAAAMGAENVIFASKGDVRVGLTYMTGTLVKLGQRLHGTLRGRPDSQWLPYFLLWAGLATGAVGGAFAFSLLGFDALWIAAAASFVLAVLKQRVLPPDDNQPG